MGEIIKINVDAALFEDLGNYSFGCVARNGSGDLVEAISVCRAGSLDPETVEALGVREALSWIKQKLWKKVIIETDCLAVVQSVRSSISMMSYFGGLINECKRLLEESSNVSLIFVRRSANNVAHYLARASYYVADRKIRSDNIPPDFLNVIMNDCK